MKIHEFQGKELFRKAGVAVLNGHVARTPAEASAAYTALGGKIAVVKSQIHAGGRGKGETKEGGHKGVKVVKSAEEAAEIAATLLGKTLVTIQTGAEGKVVNQVYVEAGCEFTRELYLSIVLDRAASKPVLMVSPAGGMDIEKVAHETPHLIFKEHFDPHAGLYPFQARKLAQNLGLKGASVASAEKLFRAVCRLFVQLDCSLVEINPLAVTSTGELVALDAKVAFDDNAMFRHKDLLELRDLTEEDPAEVRASNTGLSYVKLDGSIGCLVNGAGLAMSTMDIIKLHGGEPANFLDVGGGANEAQVTEAFRIILSDPNVKGILVNIFGGIAKCSTIANAIVAASKAVGFTVPLVVRLEGTEVEEGKRILRESGVKLIAADGLTDAAKKIVAASKNA